MKYPNITTAALGLGIVAAAGPGQTQETPGGVYATLGYANVDAGAAHLDAGQARLGYRIHRFAGVEGEVALGLGEDGDVHRAGGFSVELKHAYAAYLVGFIPLSVKTEILARVGYGEAKTSTDFGPLSVRRTTDSVNFGAGVQHHFDGRNGLRVDYTRHEATDRSRADADVWSLAFSRRF